MSQKIPKWLRPIPGYEGYYAKRDGTIWSTIYARSGGNRTITKPPRQLSYFRDSSTGYAVLYLKKDGRFWRKRVHPLILITYRGPAPPGMQARHRDNNRMNPRLSNLRWGTHAQNMADKIEHGTSGAGEERPTQSGENHGMAKITNEIARKIRDERLAGAKLRVVAAKYGVHFSTVSVIARGKIRKHQFRTQER